MKRMTLDLLITLDRSSDATEGLTRQIYAQLRQAILSGRLRAGDRLPPSRALAQELDVARLTVATAYDWLRAEGYVAGRVGAGTFVAPVFEGYAPVERAETEARAADGATNAPDVATAAATTVQEPLRPALTEWARRIQAIPLIGAGSMDGGASGAEFDFRPSIGAADLFPWARWRRIVAWQDTTDPLAELRTRARESAARVGRWDALLGPLETREAIAAWLRRSRAVRCDPDQLLIATSVQQVLALLARLLVEPGQPLLVEDPSYIGFHAAFLAEGAALCGIPVDESGIRVDALPEPAAGGELSEARLLIVTPSHQYPTGVTLSMERRMGLIEWARRAGATLVEDDYDGDLRLEGQPLEALRGLDERDEVIYLGTFAKALYPAARLAFAALPRWLIEPVARARAASDRHPAWRDALAIARFIEAGELERHLARVRRVYRARRDALVAALHAELGEIAQIGPAEAGIHLLATLPSGVDDVALAQQARTRGLAIAPLSPHYQAQARPGLLFGFGAMNEDQLTEGVRRLAPLARDAARLAAVSLGG
ncbi:MAG TPA: PLP-dependent aminotransferase family protein [Ktedonobacterales bacterium]|jgi:GntR family transcriptional regulator/MocR family aminotransferase|nr:PLP-dependent aminotransferase family protein [Ktedonobacterales bacterium]